MWYTVEYIENDILAIGENAHWEHTRSCLFRGKDVSWLVDTGTGIGNIHSLVRSLTSSPINVITTHVHWDHIGGHAQFETVYVHEQEASWLRDGIPIPLSVLKAQIPKVPFTPPQDSQFVLESYVPSRVKTPHIVHHGDCVSNSNFLLDIFHTPGHSPGSICLYERNTGYLLTGDLVYRGVIYAHYPGTDPVSLYRSYCQLSQLETIRGILPGHHDSCLAPDILAEGMNLLESLYTGKQLHHGTGEHIGDAIGFLF